MGLGRSQGLGWQVIAALIAISIGATVALWAAVAVGARADDPDDIQEDTSIADRAHPRD